MISNPSFQARILISVHQGHTPSSTVTSNPVYSSFSSTVQTNARRYKSQFKEQPLPQIEVRRTIVETTRTILPVLAYISNCAFLLRKWSSIFCWDICQEGENDRVRGNRVGDGSSVQKGIFNIVLIILMMIEEEMM